MPISNAIAFASTWGTYSGNGADNREVSHGLGRIPTMVFISRAGNAIHCVKNYGYATGAAISRIKAGAINGSSACTAMDARVFYVGNNADYEITANENGVTYYWMAV